MQLPLSDGWVLIIIFLLSVALYGGGGIAYGHKQLQRPLGPRAHPHFQYISSVAGLVADGVAFSRARLRGETGRNKSMRVAESQEKREKTKHSSSGSGSKKESKEKNKSSSSPSKSADTTDVPLLLTSADYGGDSPGPAAAAAGTSAGGGGRWVRVEN